MSTECLLSALVRDEPYVLTRITGLFGHRGHHIRSLSVTPTDQPNLSRIVLTVNGDPDAVDRAVRQLEKLYDVLEVAHHCPGSS